MVNHKYEVDRVLFRCKAPSVGKFFAYTRASKSLRLFSAHVLTAKNFIHKVSLLGAKLFPLEKVPETLQRK